MKKPHDIGGSDTVGPINQKDHTVLDWELHIDAIRQVLGNNGIINTDELRNSIESISPYDYQRLLYYERWAVALRSLLIEKAIFSELEIDQVISQTKVDINE
tara:strand:+ start:656 stop:961 length:306 start_codon:yes stop_codon:yes gene_type:complete